MMNDKPVIIKDDISVVICGEAGQGIQTVEQILTRVLKFSGYNVFATKEYMSRIRGGSNSTEIRVSSNRVTAFVDKIDILLPLDKDAILHLKKRIADDTIIIGDKETLQTNHDIIDISFTKLATAIGNKIYANVIAVGTVSNLLNVEKDVVCDYIRKYFSKKGEEIIQKNIEAVNKGYEICAEYLCTKIKIDIQKKDEIKDELLLNGAESVAIGALAGGCNFVSSYPMTPSTGVLVFLSGKMNDFDILSEQAEDEISAINMALGASYAGARALVTTSGGGFALMEEGISLSGMIETPIVIHLAQRPGPATGLPTRTEQGDLEFALYSGHGEFPRVIFAPGKLDDAFYLTQKAFNLADKYQIPVFILTDQTFIDSYYNMPSINISSEIIENYFIKTDKNYKRYQITDNGISPRGIPGFGDGLIAVDSDEHDEEGHITEDLDLRIQMVDKRLKKLELIKKEIVSPELIGNNNYKTLIIGWGSTYPAIKEALDVLGQDDIAFLHFKQVYPIHPETLDYLKKAQKVIIVENNATSQFSKLIKLYTGFDIQTKILKYNGLPFFVEELVGRLKEVIKET